MAATWEGTTTREEMFCQFQLYHGGKYITRPGMMLLKETQELGRDKYVEIRYGDGKQASIPLTRIIEPTSIPRYQELIDLPIAPAYAPENQAPQPQGALCAPEVGEEGYWYETRYHMRNGKRCGPYRYKRWREGGHKRSQYMGRVASEAS